MDMKTYEILPGSDNLTKTDRFSSLISRIVYVSLVRKFEDVPDPSAISNSRSHSVEEVTFLVTS